uniref:CARD domain-containing protein n=1 Tax=Clastoptera arizonana TaxID=38151 RepID=A0A1B6E0E3_9HEMI
MNNKEISIINKHRQLILDDLHNDVFEMLFEKNFLSMEEYKSIRNKDTQLMRNEELLFILIGKHDGFQLLKNETKKDYDWIFRALNDKDVDIIDEYSLAVEGGVPPIPVHNVTRKILLEKVQTSLKSLKRGHYLVLKGMIGCGKSSLAAQSLNQSLIMELFNSKVFWISAGKVTSDDAWELLAELYERNFQDELKRDLKRAQAQLRKSFRESNLKHSLIILDDVGSRDVIEAFDIGCKVLVTTNDEDVMIHRESVTTIIKVDEGFTEKETLKLLAKCVNTDVESLPPQAKLIYLQSKGYPMTVSLIGAQLSDHQEEAIEVPKNWDLYVQSLNNKDSGNIKRRSLVENHGIISTLNLCMGRMDPQLQSYYQDFALFVEDVNIKPEVLQTLWSISIHDVKTDVMQKFINKSLAVKTWNRKLSSYVYGIHDLLLEYLKRLLSEEQLCMKVQR